MIAERRGLLDTPISVARQTLGNCVRLTHLALFRKELPRKIAVYFHELEPQHWAAFREAIVNFHRLGYEMVNAREFASDQSNRKLLFISFDDNFASWHAALEMMNEFGTKATFYVNTLPFRDTCDNIELDGFFARIAHKGVRQTLRRSDLADFIAAGHEIGCHSHSHFNLARLNRSQWDDEIRRSKEILEEITSREIDAFSYPYGMRRFFSEALREYCAAIGFRTIATGIPGLQQKAPIVPLNLHRTRWILTQPLERNIADIHIDGALFEQLTGRSAIS